MKTIRRYITIYLLLILVGTSLLCGIIPMVSGIKTMDTPIANLSKDNYVQNSFGENYDINAFNKDIKSLGGCVYTQQEYENLFNNKGIISDVSNVASVEPIKQVIKVMTTPTGSDENKNYKPSVPIANAVVLINGVPRFTDRDGQVKVTLDKEYVELIVEKDDYNPYIEIMEVSSQEKVVYLKKESDDIDIYGVMLTDIETLPINLINSSYSILLKCQQVYIANLKFLVNVKADRYKLLLEDDVIYSSKESIIYDLNFTGDMENKKFYAQVEYQGIVSKKLELKLKINKDIKDFNNNSKDHPLEKLNPFNGIETNGILSGFSIDLSKLMNFMDFENIFDSSSQSSKDPKISLVYDARKQTITFSIGFTIKPNLDKNQDEAKKKLENYKEEEQDNNKERSRFQKAANDLQDEYDRLKNIADQNKLDEIAAQKREQERFLDNVNEQKKYSNNKIKNSVNVFNSAIDNANNFLKQGFKSIKELINNKNDGLINKENFDKQTSTLKNFVKDLNDNTKFVQTNKGVMFGIDIMAVFEFNYVDSLLSSGNITIDGKFTFNYESMFFVYFVPMFYYLNVTAGLKAEITFLDKNGWIGIHNFLQRILVKPYIDITAGFGVGLNDVLSAKLEGNIAYTLKGYLLMPAFWDHLLQNLGSELDLGIYVKIKVLFFEWQWGIGENWDNEYKSPEDILRPRPGLSLMLSNNDINMSNNIYEGSKTKIEKIGDKYVASWVDMTFNGDIPSTKIKYSVFDDGQWSEPKAVDCNGNAFYHDMYFDGKDLHLTWQNVSENADVSSLEQMSKESEIFYAKFDVTASKFTNITQLTNNDSMDAAPHFVLKENDKQNLAIAWQRNTANDLLGLTGKNSIVCSEIVNGSWSASKILYQSDNYFSFVDTAYVDGKLTTTCIEDLDNDLFTNDRKIKVITNGKPSIIVGDNFTEVNNPQFNKINGKVALSFYADGAVHYSYNYDKMETFNVAQGKINDTYKILENDNKLYIYYYKLASDGSQQAFSSFYDKTLDMWQTDVCLTESEKQVLNPAIIILDNGDILTMYNASETQQSEQVSLEYHIKQMRKDFEITYAFFDMDSKVGDSIALHIGIKNTGDYTIKNVQINAFGKTDNIVLENALQIDETIFLEVEREFSINNQGIEIISCQYENVQKEYYLATKMTDIAIDGNVWFDNFKEYYDLTLTNNSEYVTKVYLDVYCNGKIVDTIQFEIQGNDLINYTYSNEDFENGSFIYFVVRTDIADKYQSDNEISFCVRNMADKINIVSNPYYDIMQQIKQF